VIRASTKEMIIRYKVKWGHSPNPNMTRRVDRPALLTTRIEEGVPFTTRQGH